MCTSTNLTRQSAWFYYIWVSRELVVYYILRKWSSWIESMTSLFIIRPTHNGCKSKLFLTRENFKFFSYKKLRKKYIFTPWSLKLITNHACLWKLVFGVKVTNAWVWVICIFCKTVITFSVQWINFMIILKETSYCSFQNIYLSSFKPLI